MRKLLDTYTIYARHFPALLSALPFFVIWFYLSDNFQLKGVTAFILNIKIFGEITVAIVLLYACALVIRELSKCFQRKYFTDKKAKGFPTTYLMMYSDSTLSDGYKDKYRTLISAQFNFQLLNKGAEQANMDEARKRLNDAADLVKEDIKGGHLVLKHNIWFGFFRNLIGGTIISMPTCIVGILLGSLFECDSATLNLILVVLLVFYLVVFLFRRSILVHNGEAYARKLFAEFVKAHT